MPYRVFLSHSGTDAPWVKYIAGRAQAVGVEAYLYEHDPQPGHLIAEKVKQAIARSDAVVVLLTRSAHRSAYVQQEIGFAEAKGKLVVPLVEPGVDEEGLAMLEAREQVVGWTRADRSLQRSWPNSPACSSAFWPPAKPCSITRGGWPKGRAGISHHHITRAHTGWTLDLCLQ